MQIIESIKSHPKLAIGAVVGLLLIVYVINHSGANTSVAAGGSVDGSSVEAATAIQQAQMQSQMYSQQISAASQSDAAKTAATLELGKLQIAQAGTHDELAAQVATSQLSTTAQVQSLLASLSAGVANNNSNNQTSVAINSSNNQVQMQQILADALTHQSDAMSNVSIANINASKEVATQSWWDSIF